MLREKRTSLTLLACLWPLLEVKQFFSWVLANLKPWVRFCIIPFVQTRGLSFSDFPKAPQGVLEEQAPVPNLVTTAPIVTHPSHEVLCCGVGDQEVCRGPGR